jgi:hypothetical protein
MTYDMAFRPECFEAGTYSVRRRKNLPCTWFASDRYQRPNMLTFGEDAKAPNTCTNDPCAAFQFFIRFKMKTEAGRRLGLCPTQP